MQFDLLPWPLVCFLTVMQHDLAMPLRLLVRRSFWQLTVWLFAACRLLRVMLPCDLWLHGNTGREGDSCRGSAELPFKTRLKKLPFGILVFAHAL